ncbi:MAG: chorismate mutase [Spirochaetaceae bacterium]|jgi:chorismate mutase|nr:chorismate mutase [Spirochaetaceae bacterium]
MKKLYALRGAVCCCNTEDDIRTQTADLYRALLEANGLAEDDIVSAVFSVTAGLDAKNPCAALREAGYAQHLALFAVQEACVKGMMDNVIRVLIHCYLEDGADIRHVYTNGAQVLRPDREGQTSLQSLARLKKGDFLG